MLQPCQSDDDEDDDDKKYVEKRIDQVKVGDKVLSFDENTMKTSYQRVIHIAHIIDDDLVNEYLCNFRRLCYDSGCIVMTHGHLIYANTIAISGNDRRDDMILIPAGDIDVGNIINIYNTDNHSTEQVCLFFFLSVSFSLCGCNFFFVVHVLFVTCSVKLNGLKKIYVHIQEIY